MIEEQPLSQSQYEAWQAQLLEEMGITRWVNQHSPVIELSADIFESQLNATIQEPSTENSESPSVKTTQIDDYSAHQNFSSLQSIYPRVDVVSDSFGAAISHEPAEPSAIGLAHDSSNAIQVRCALQAIKVYDWVLITDTDILQKDPRQQLLWQHIVNSFKASLHFFNFPLLDKTEHLPKSALQVISNANMAKAGFSGFMFSITQTNDIKIGNLTPLPDYLDDDRIQRLPYLEEMLTDYRHKRQLWLLLSS